MVQDAINVWDRIYNEGTADVAPWLRAGQGGVNQLAFLMGLSGDKNAEGYGSLARRFSMDDFETDPGYQFRLGEGEKAINRASAARGSYFAPQTVKDLGQYNQNFALNEFSNARNRYNEDQGNLYNRLFGLSSAGQTAAGQKIGLGANYASGLSNIYMQMEALRQAQRGGGLGGSLLGGLGSLAGGYFSGGGTLGGLFS